MTMMQSSTAFHPTKLIVLCVLVTCIARTHALAFHGTKQIKYGITQNSSFLQRKSSATLSTFPPMTTSTCLHAAKGGGKKKRKRRRKEVQPPTSAPKDTTPSSTVGQDVMGGDELPDFDLFEDGEDAPAPIVSGSGPTSIASPMASASTASNLNLDDPEIIEAMRVTNTNANSAQMSSTKDLLRSRDRELEQKFIVNTVSEEVPNLADYTMKRNKKSGSGAPGEMGKKATRAAARRAAAIEAEMEGVEDESLLSKLPFIGGKKDADEKLDPLKVLENGTWAGIFALVAWEVYLNSPFFDRAGPMAPIVFSDPTTMT